jgi:hypothetical protein
MPLKWLADTIALMRGLQVALEDALAYDEPWGWMSPVRHALGALLLEQGRVSDAEEVYRADLMPGRHPNNIWALHGLHTCLAAAPGGAAALSAAAEALATAQEAADVEVTASCACARSAWGGGGEAAAAL